ncbi:hypothetical protein ABID22_002997 [Pontibacter aydingkolensis]|uniref:Lipoprotein n=1 Tax=Pontibacter aydingkolensis TaxID=1911536 RepID=A0ABS7CUY3_9BACT|nr:hypothetical protein [Pontibacter aydingkolensis]MBW7467491.1 hypothetical protein [Pontibacter aydingkolensis]
MKNTLFMLLLIAFSCSPKNEEIKDEQIALGSKEKALDSIANTEQDGVIVDDTGQDTYLPLPQPVLQLLAQKYPGYKKPMLANAARDRAAGNEQGPFLISGDFTNDTHLDHALQLQQDKNIFIVAATDTGNGSWTLHELKRDVLFNDRGTLKSLYYLQLTEPGQTLLDSESRSGFELKNNAVSVGLENDLTTYVYSDNGFKAYPSYK